MNALMSLCLVVLGHTVTAFSSDSKLLQNINIKPLRPNVIDIESESFTFDVGSTNDFFSTMTIMNSYMSSFMLVGSKNKVYKLSLPNLNKVGELTWNADENNVRNCLGEPSFPKEICANYIVYMQPVEQDVHDAYDNVMICGSNSDDKMICRRYKVADDPSYAFHQTEQLTGLYFSRSPFLPHAMQFFHTFPGSGSLKLVAGANVDSQGAGIYTLSLNTQITNAANDALMTNMESGTPEFVKIIDDGRDHIYIVFRSVEKGQDYYAKGFVTKIGRICKNEYKADVGYARLRSYSDVRLQCSMFNDDKHQYISLDYLNDVSKPILSEGKRFFYTLSSSSGPMAMKSFGICKFDLDDVDAALETGNYFLYDATHSVKSVVPDIETARLRRKCSIDSKFPAREPSEVIDASNLVTNVYRQLIVLNGNSERIVFTSIFVVPQVMSTEQKPYDVIYLGTADGKVYKYVAVDLPIENVYEMDMMKPDVKTHLVQIMRVADESIKQLAMSVTEGSPSKLILMTNRTVRSVPLHGCASAKSCSECVYWSDPMCAWKIDESNKKGYCAGSVTGFPAADNKQSSRLYQNVVTGESPSCEGSYSPPAEYAVDGISHDNAYRNSEIVNRNTFDYQLQVKEGRGFIYSAGSMALGVVLTLIIAMSVGFFVGYKFFSYRAGTHKYSETASSSGGSSSSGTYDHTMLTASNYATVGTFPRGSVGKNFQTGELDIYSNPPYKRGDAPALNFLLNEANGVARADKLNLAPSSIMSQSTNSSALTSPFLLNNGTLPKDYKTRKVYV